MITSLQNPSVKEVVKLREKRIRAKTGLFLVEGERECLRAMEKGWNFHKVFFSPALFTSHKTQDFLAQIESKGVETIEVAPHVFEKISYREGPDGLLAQVAQQTYKKEDLKKAWHEKKSKPFLLVVESIEKPGNLGSMLRSVDAAGVDGVILIDEVVDLFNPNVVRASMGTLFSVPIVTMGLQEAIEWFSRENIELVAATPHAELVYTKTNLTRGVAIAMGSEKEGLSREFLSATKTHVAIPMLGLADSLNVAGAALLLLFEAVRQRRL